MSSLTRPLVVAPSPRIVAIAPCARLYRPVPRVASASWRSPDPSRRSVQSDPYHCLGPSRGLRPEPNDYYGI
jgi:hypothetical protein